MTSESDLSPPIPESAVLEPEQPPSVPAPAPKKKSWRGLLGLFLIVLAVLAAITVGLSYRLWQQLQHDRQMLIQQIEEMQSSLQNLKAQSQAANQQVEEKLSRLTQLETRQKNLEDSLGELYSRQRKTGDPEEQSLNDVRYLLHIAQQRLTLGNDIEAALTALQVADDRLKTFKDPRLLEVRRQLAAEINSIRQLDLPDVVGMILRLQDYANRIYDLALLQGRQQTSREKGPVTEKTAAPKLQSWQDIANAVWAELKQLVVIRYNEGAEIGLLSPEQRYFLSQNLRLKIEGARFALLRRNAKEFQETLQDIQNWLKRYYDQNDARVSALQKDLADMQAEGLDWVLPDISKSLALLEKLLARPEPQERGEEKSGETETETESPAAAEDKTP